jgi:acyl dehydratase
LLSAADQIGSPLSLTRRLAAAWSALSGDFNPIHIAPLGAAALGFRRPPGVKASATGSSRASGGSVVAHGMSLAHMALAERLLPELLRRRGAEALSAAKAVRCVLDVSFVRPSFLPCSLYCQSDIASAPKDAEPATSKAAFALGMERSCRDGAAAVDAPKPTITGSLALEFIPA